ncbi:hypothetical protein Salat_2146100 [Sesamum alatum]|uniref:Uncharacterized protein n=1 Tax=Sesamum alatum TaxID=300844 RepID=A0AAE2CH86_9LAMI|nr:hypothetical protein Salat_2146100 [Sesamum alatum]
MHGTPNPSVDDDGSRASESADEVAARTETLSTKFCFKEFMMLAERVIDGGDVEAVAMLERLRTLWEAKVGVMAEDIRATTGHGMAAPSLIFMDSPRDSPPATNAPFTRQSLIPTICSVDNASPIFVGHIPLAPNVALPSD